MTIAGSCLCGGVRFELDGPFGTFELCHCRRCRKATGAAGLPALAVPRERFRLAEGASLVASYRAPLLHGPPACTRAFCRRCGAPVPLASDDFEDVEAPAGLLDDEPAVTIDKHIFVEWTPAWDPSRDDLPRYTRPELIELRRASGHDPSGDRVRSEATGLQRTKPAGP